MLKNALRIVLVVVFAFGIISIWEGFKTGSWLPNFGGVPQTTHNTVLQEVQTLGKLELVRYNFKDVVEHEIVREFMPNSKAILIVQGEAVGCIDLTKMRASDITSDHDTLVVHLPDPELCTFKIDHSKSKVYNTEFAFLEEAQMVQEAYQKAEIQIKNSAMQMGIFEQTKKNAQLILVPMLEKISAHKVVLRYPIKATIPSPK